MFIMVTSVEIHHINYIPFNDAHGEGVSKSAVKTLSHFMCIEMHEKSGMPYVNMSSSRF